MLGAPVEIRAKYFSDAKHEF